MVVDTSALMAVLLKEPLGADCRGALGVADTLEMSAGTLAETLIVAQMRGLAEAMGLLLAGLPITVFPVDGAFARRVADAYAAWGKGVHPAGLNIMDCYAYVLACDRGGELLFVGRDFARTDIKPALAG